MRISVLLFHSIKLRKIYELDVTEVKAEPNVNYYIYSYVQLWEYEKYNKSNKTKPMTSNNLRVGFMYNI